MMKMMRRRERERGGERRSITERDIYEREREIYECECVCVCVCLCLEKRERERERERERFNPYRYWIREREKRDNNRYETRPTYRVLCVLLEKVVTPTTP